MRLLHCRAKAARRYVAAKTAPVSGAPRRRDPWCGGSGRGENAGSRRPGNSYTRKTRHATISASGPEELLAQPPPHVFDYREHQRLHVPAGRDDRHVPCLVPQRRHAGRGVARGDAQQDLAHPADAGILQEPHQTDSEKVFTIYQELKIPADQRAAFERDRTGCVIGRDLANKYKLNIGDRMALVGDIFPGDYEFTIRGIFDSPRASEIMYFSREYLEQSLPERRRGQAGVFTILIDDPSSAGRIAAAIDNEYRNATAQTKTESEQQYLLG